MKNIRYKFWRKSLVIGFLMFFTFIPSANSEYERFFSTDRTVIKVPIDDLFDEECLSCNGRQILQGLKDEINSKNIILECSVNRKSKYDSDWELANIYAYKTALYLIQCCGIKPSDITYIGYGSMSKFDNNPNRIEITILDK